MYFLVDLENVHDSGMHGSEYLCPSDHVILFYSEAAKTLETRYLDNIKNSGAKFEICRLKVARKNALDFYIVSKAGEIFGTGYKGAVGIISQDAGFISARDYWTACAQPPRRLVLGENFEKALIAAKLGDQRTKLLNTITSRKDIANYYAVYQENQRIRNKLEELFADTEYLPRISEIKDFLDENQGKPQKVIYLDTLKRFGRKDGLAVYRQLKAMGDK